MELAEIIEQLRNLISEADFALSAGDVDEATNKLRAAKELLEVTLLAE